MFQFLEGKAWEIPNQDQHLEVIENKTYILAQQIISLILRLMHCIFFIVNEKHVITAVAKLTTGSYG